MKTIQFKVLVWAMALTFPFVFSACNGVVEKDDVNSKDDKEKVEPVSSDPSVTVGSEHISAVSVVLQGKANLDSSIPSVLMVGFQYSLSQGILPSNSTTVVATDADAQYNYSSGITGLKPGTTYYFRSIVKMSGNNHYGETMSFTTKPLSTMLETKEASDIAPTSAKMNAKLNLTDVQYTTMDYGFYWGTSEDSQTTYVKGGEIAGNAYFASLNDLSHKTQYWYKAYLKVDGQEFYEAVKTFTTDVVPVKGVTLDKTACTVHTIGSTFTLTATINPADATNKAVSWKSSNTSVATVDANGKVTAKGNGSATITVTTDDQGKTATCEVVVGQNLSANASANCYVVPSAGGYYFRTTKGNSDTSVGSVSSVSVLWESYGTSTTPSVGSIINNVSYSSNTITFSTPTTLENGNAVIAAKDASGNILWSWHIWVCSGYDPVASAQTYYNNAGTMMDRNLGATSATPGDVGALGLLYQWGRKDPFLGSSSILSGTMAKSTLSTWPSPVSSNSGNGTIAYAVKNPTTFITASSSTQYDWVYSSRDNTLWQSAKTIYDPCPPGWKVPAGGSSGIWSKAVNSSSYFTCDWDSTNRGMNFSGKFGSADTIWYPAAGCLGYNDGSLNLVNTGGCGWSCTPYGSRAYSLYLYYDGTVSPSHNSYRAGGRSVRCLQE